MEEHGLAPQQEAAAGAAAAAGGRQDAAEAASAASAASFDLMKQLVQEKLAAGSVQMGKAEGAAIDLSKRSYFYCKCCPTSNCSSQLWKKARVWGWDEEEARLYLIQHLVHSGHHQFTPENAKKVADATQMEFFQGEEPPLKQPRRIVSEAEVLRSAPQTPHLPPPALQLSVPGAGASQLAAAPPGARFPPPMPPLFSPAAGAPHLLAAPPGANSSVAQTLTLPLRAPETPRGVVPDSHVLISQQTLDGLIDACTRASRSLHNAQRLSMAAAISFSEEQGVINDAKAALEALRR